MKEIHYEILRLLKTNIEKDYSNFSETLTHTNNLLVLNEQENAIAISQLIEWEMIDKSSERIFYIKDKGQLALQAYELKQKRERYVSELQFEQLQGSVEKLQ